MSNKIVKGDGVDLAVQVQGNPEGPTVLLVHGYPDTHAVWDGVAARLADRYRVVTYDVRGAGASSRPKGREAYRFAHLMNDLRAVVEEVGQDGPVHLVGHDWGSIQGWEAVTTMPELFASYTSISGPCLDHAGRWNRAFAGTAKGLRQALRSWYIAFFHLPVLPVLGWRTGFAAKVVARAEGMRTPHFGPTIALDGEYGVQLYRANILPRMRHPQERRTDVPVQLVIPEHDAFVTPALAASALPFASRITRVPLKAGHWAPVSRPAEIADLVDRHIGTV
ncbi:pimeloyl-ACP methyl ester carboxylesterase [Actinocorallia herbida]|uniref:Pimeloyl-ACP methyl ester carboxylesterase n=1 Tax=Actinocorallia herbida TaxID=58109 RepID=A0A3N1D475_9ACTN|nr:alpha/beta fold hydrolase [Actinocorallia herbida]ROO88299.1 pimeloyl-ACP methyl ester carboxylesterase [Actinocorallia herbida]